MKPNYIFITLLVIASLGLVGEQFVTSRDPLSDQIKSEDIANITYAVDNYASANKRLPSKLPDLTFSSPLRGKLSSYQYVKTIGARDKYQLCTDFKTDTTKKTNRSSGYVDPYYHAKGHVCFSEQSYMIPASSIQ